MFLFEYFWTVVAIGTTLTVTLFVLRVLTENPVHARFALAALGLTGILATAAALIVTPRERIIETCRSLARIADEGDVSSLDRYLAPSFQANGLERAVWLDRVSAVLTRTRLDHVRIRGIHVEWESPGRANVTFNATCNIRTAEGFGSYIPTRWRLRFDRIGDSWLLTTVESIPVPPLFLKNPVDDR